MLTINSMTAASVYANKLAQKSGLNTPANGGSAVATAQALAEAVEKAKEQAGTVQKNYTQSDNRHTSAAAIANAAESKETDADTKRAQLTQNVSDVIASLRDKLSGADSSASQSSVSAYDKMTALAMQKLQEQQDAARDKAYNAVINNKTLREDEVTISKKAFELAKNAYANAVEGSQNGAAQVTSAARTRPQPRPRRRSRRTALQRRPSRPTKLKRPMRRSRSRQTPRRRIPQSSLPTPQQALPQAPKRCKTAP